MTRPVASHASDRAVAAPPIRFARDPIDPALVAACYEEMRQIARRLLAGGDRHLLVQPTDLAHDAAIRLLRLDRMQFASQAPLLATAARITRQALIDEARRARRLKRQAPAMMTMVGDVASAPIGLEELDAAVGELARVSPEHAEIVELRFTLGLTIEETATVTGQSARTIKRRWAATRAWLQAWLDAHAGTG